MEARSSDRRTSIDHLDGTSFSFECAESQGSISFTEVSGYGCVSCSLVSCFEPCAPTALRWRLHRVPSLEVSRIPGHKNRAASARVRPPAKHRSEERRVGKEC